MAPTRGRVCQPGLPTGPDAAPSSLREPVPRALCPMPPHHPDATSAGNERAWARGWPGVPSLGAVMAAVVSHSRPIRTEVPIALVSPSLGTALGLRHCLQQPTSRDWETWGAKAHPSLQFGATPKANPAPEFLLGRGAAKAGRRPCNFFSCFQKAICTQSSSF